MTMGGQPDQNNQLAAPRTGDNSRSGRPKDSHYPELQSWKKSILALSTIILFVFLLVALDQVFFQPPTIFYLPSHTSLAYIGFAVSLLCFFVVRYLIHQRTAYNERLEDPSAVRSWIVDAQTVVARLTDPERPEHYDQKKQDLNVEVERLEKLGQERWTEYEVLSLKQMLVDFRKVDDLITEAQSLLDELNEYAEDSSYRYDREYYGKWEQRIREAQNKISDVREESTKRDTSAEPLRAELRTLYEHVANYRWSWTEGTTIIHGLIFVGVVAIPAIVVMGLIPILHPAADRILGVLNWGLLGIAGALTAALLALRQSDAVEVGNTEGKKELWRTILGAALGLVAGILSYGIISGQLLEGSAVPTIGSDSLADVGLSIVWGMASGFSFERIFERMRSATEGGS